MGETVPGRESVGPNPAAKVVSPDKRKQKQAPIAGVDITEEQTLATLLVCVFGTVSLLTGHAWWEKSEQDVRPISEPLSRIIRDRVPRKTVEELQKLYDPIALIIGLAIVVGPLVALELDARRGGGRSAPSGPSGDPGGARTGDGVSPNGAGRAHQSVSPAYPEAGGRDPAF